MFDPYLGCGLRLADAGWSAIHSSSLRQTVGGYVLRHPTEFRGSPPCLQPARDPAVSGYLKKTSRPSYFLSMIRVRRHPSTAKPTTSTCHQAMGQSDRDSDSEDSNCIYWGRKGLGTGPDVYLPLRWRVQRATVGVDLWQRRAVHSLPTRLPLPPGLEPDLAAANVLGDRLRVRRVVQDRIVVGPQSCGESDSLACCSLSIPFSNLTSNLLASHQYWTSPRPRRSQRRLPPDCEATKYASPLLFQAGDVVWAAEARGEAHQYQGTNTRPVHQQTALHLVHGVYCCCPLLVQKIKILKLDEDGAPSQPLSDDCGEGDTSALCAVRTASRQPHGGPRRDSQKSRGNTTSSAGARRSIRSRTRSADSSTSRSTVGCSGGSGSIGGSGEGARRSSSWRRARPGNLSNDGDRGSSPSQRSRLTDRTSMDEDIEINQLLRHVTQGGSQTHHAGDEAQLWELSMAFEFAPSRGYIHFHSIH
ncbi:hypothetical protein THAOC_05888 [Thalassiosira oceanica]|uniref:Uncharacterized protein n=1 Tax=Thalassiosira oceanica TaxID=159749 RepID=K0T4E8_THAOC|nr:hypothetical protein THAOC_05888 [Thalassiosira oceanica]|eukprot:EJK72570.1 hypothetical protein THAOC_05888 [Thalassiosira oceanica]